MRLRLPVLLLAVLCILSTRTSALETVRVLVLPFEIHAQEEFSYLETEVPDLIKKHLTRDGASVVEADITLPLWKEKAGTMDGIRNFGIEKGADYVIWGSVTRIGEQFSLDAKMLESFGEDPPSVYFLEGENLQNLPGNLRKLADRFGLRLFRREKVSEVIIEGNNRIEDEAIKRIIKTKPGDIYLAKSLSKDLKSVYAMGYFDDIRVEAEKGPDGNVIIFRVKEKPTIRVIRLKGNRDIKDDKLKETLTLQSGSILNIFKIQSNIQRIEAMYREDNYHNVEVDYKIHPLKNNQADLDFIIKEGDKLLVQKIIFDGNKAYSDKELKKVMETSEKGFFSFITLSGDLKMEDLKQDIETLSAYYKNNGYIDARVGEPQIEYKKKWIHIKIKVVEGPRFKIGKVDIGGEFIAPKKEMVEKLTIAEGMIYNREMVRKDVLTLTDLYTDQGYAFAEVMPRIRKDKEALTVDITFTITKGKKVFFEKIIITGNTKTRDKIIRRQLQVYEQESFSSKWIKRSIRNLYRLDYFEDIKVDTMKGSADDQMILKIDVTEKPTGSFTLGGGYSSVEDLFASGSMTQRNLFGRGQILNFEAQIGGRTTLFNLSFTEPWLFDIPLSAGIDLFNMERNYDDYTKDSVGGGVRFGYRVFDFTRAYLTYGYEDADIRDIADDAAQSIKDLEGKNVTSSITTRLRYDSRNRMFIPSEGSLHNISLQYAGLGGNIGFTKLTGGLGWFIPLFLGTVGSLHGEGGYVTENSGKILPDYEKFYLGGINSIRGFSWQDIFVLDENGNKIGGESYVQFNVEYIFPLVKQAGVYGVAFYDTGNVFGKGESVDLGDLRHGAGAGVRWLSPIGPIRLEWGYNLDPRPGEDSDGRWEFTMGTQFR
jgi:outer membrane protein insertion porin family